MTTHRAPQPLTVPELLQALAALGAPAQVPAHLDDADAVLHLSHGLVGAAERKAMEAELAVRAGGADSPEILPAIEEAYAAANAHSRLDVLAHVQWRATRLVQAPAVREAELGVVIGRPGRSIAEPDALDHVAGNTVVNDITVRDWQHRTRRHDHQLRQLHHHPASRRPHRHRDPGRRRGRARPRGLPPARPGGQHRRRRDR